MHSIDRGTQRRQSSTSGKGLARQCHYYTHGEAWWGQHHAFLQLEQGNMNSSKYQSFLAQNLLASSRKLKMKKTFSMTMIQNTHLNQGFPNMFLEPPPTLIILHVSELGVFD